MLKKIVAVFAILSASLNMTNKSFAIEFALFFKIDSDVSPTCDVSSEKAHKIYAFRCDELYKSFF
jgi:hypothetical protein